MLTGGTHWHHVNVPRMLPHQVRGDGLRSVYVCILGYDACLDWALGTNMEDDVRWCDFDVWLELLKYCFMVLPRQQTLLNTHTSYKRNRTTRVRLQISRQTVREKHIIYYSHW